MRKCKSENGFTLAELLIVVAIIAVLTAIAIPVFATSLDKAGRAVDMANVRSMKSVLAVSYLDGTVQFPYATVPGTGFTACLTIYATRDEVLYYGSGQMLVNGKDWSSDSGAYARIEKLFTDAGLNDITVHAKNTDGAGWDYYAVILYSDGTVRIAGNPGSLPFAIEGSGYFEPALEAYLPAAGTTNLEKAMSGGS